MNISIIGTGNLAYQITHAIDTAGHNIQEIYSRKIESAEKLANSLENATAQSHLNFSESLARLFIVAVSDNAIEAISNEIILPDDAIIVHTSGSAPMAHLENSGLEDFGIFYPLQTFTKNSQLSFDEIPIIINSSSEYALKGLLELAESISKHVVQLTDEQRQELHLAAVFANNFVNYTIGAAFELLSSSGIEKQILQPLIEETVRKSLLFDPKSIQTGPAKREDYNTIGKHIELLSNDEKLLAVYKAITSSIISDNGDSD
jgi:predicted short-subunit dehydrogenase-like oxidoreductase (DUF2520 family)